MICLGELSIYVRLVEVVCLSARCRWFVNVLGVADLSRTKVSCLSDWCGCCVEVIGLSNGSM